MYSVDCGEIAICETCAYFNEYGESPADTADGPTPLSLISFGYEVTPGGNHHEGCTDNGDCECDNLGFSWQSCDACGDLDGDRFRFTLWRLSATEARKEFDRAIKVAHWARKWESFLPRDGNGVTITALNLAADYRRYLASLAKEQRQHAAWLAARGIAA